MAGPDRSWDRRIGERVRLRELRILHAVVRAGSMARAAQALSMTQSAVSQAIGLLEAALDVPVLERSPTGVVPTAFGTVLLRRAMEAADLLADGLREIGELADPGAGDVVVGASESYIAGGALAATIGRCGSAIRGFGSMWSNRTPPRWISRICASGVST